MGELIGQEVGNFLVRVYGEGKDFRKHFGFGEAGQLDVNVRLGHAGIDQVPRIFAVENSEITLKTEQGCAAAAGCGFQRNGRCRPKEDPSRARADRLHAASFHVPLYS